MSSELPARPDELDHWRAEVARDVESWPSKGLVSDILGHVSVRVGGGPNA